MLWTQLDRSRRSRQRWARCPAVPTQPGRLLQIGGRGTLSAIPSKYSQCRSPVTASVWRVRQIPAFFAVLGVRLAAHTTWTLGSDGTNVSFRALVGNYMSILLSLILCDGPVGSGASGLRVMSQSSLHLSSKSRMSLLPCRVWICNMTPNISDRISVRTSSNRLKHTYAGSYSYFRSQVSQGHA